VKAHERLEWCIAYGLAIVSAATASLYGVLSAPPPYGWIKGAGLFGVAFIGCHGPAWIVKAKQRLGWPGALFGCVVTAICLGATLWGGLGTNASGGAALRAERDKLAAMVAADRAELETLRRERASLPTFQQADQDTVRAARETVVAAERTRIAECGNGDPKQRGPNCRVRETEEGVARATLATAMAHRAATERAAKLDEEATKVQARLDRAAPAVDADPQASAFSQLTGFPVATSAALYAFWLALAFELGAMFALMMAYSNTTAPSVPAVTVLEPPSPKLEAESAPAPEPIARAEPPPALRRSNVTPIRREREVGDIAKFVTACCEPAAGSIVVIGSLYRPYKSWCAENGFRAVDTRQFEALFIALCDLARLERHTEAGRAVCSGLKLAA
jgi:Poxvirus D5 protein-like